MKKWQSPQSSIMQDGITHTNSLSLRDEAIPVKNNKRRAHPKNNIVCVLIAMTDKLLRSLVEEALSEHFRISILEDAAQITKVCLYQNPKVIIVDEFVNGEYGYNICSQIQANKETKSIPVIALVNSTDNKILSLYTKRDVYQLHSRSISPNILIENIYIAMKNIAEKEKSYKKFLASTYSSNLDVIPGKNKDEQALMERIHTFLEKNITSKYSVAMLSKDIGMCRSNLYNKIEEITNICPKHYIDLYRLKKAEQMLLSQKYTIAEIADYLGYCDAKYFAKKFKSVYHVSPTKYVEQKIKHD